LGQRIKEASAKRLETRDERVSGKLKEILAFGIESGVLKDGTTIDSEEFQTFMKRGAVDFNLQQRPKEASRFNELRRELE
jgi:hypothetical protein